MLSIAFEIFHYFFTLAGLNPALPALHLLILDLILYFNFPFTIYLLLRAIFEKRPEGSMGDVIFSSIAVGTNIAYWLTIGYAMQTVWA